MSTYTWPLRALALGVAFIGFGTFVAAETTLCTAITGLPWMISSPGTFCLMADLTTTATSGPAILINSSSVTIDLNGHKLGGPASASSTAIGIYANGRRFLVIKNGTIRGFDRAVSLVGSGYSNIIEDIMAERSFFQGLYVEGKGIVIRRNLIVNTGLTTAHGASPLSAGIFAAGTGIVIRDNDINTVYKTTTSFSLGIYVDGDYGMVDDNRISNAHNGMQLSPTSKYRNNLTTDITMSAFISGIDAGGNH